MEDELEQEETDTLRNLATSASTTAADPPDLTARAESQNAATTPPHDLSLAAHDNEDTRVASEIQAWLT